MGFWNCYNYGIDGMTEKEITVIGVLYIGMIMQCLSGEKEKFTAVFGEKIFKIFVIGYVELVPVIEPRTLELFVINGKTHRFDYVKSCTGGGTGTGNITGVLRYFRLYQNYI